MVEIPRPFDGAQDMLQAKRRSVMPAPDQSRGQASAGIQGGEGVAITESLIPAFAGKTEREYPVEIVQIPRLRAEGCLISHRREQFAERRAIGDVALLVGVLRELFQHDLVLRR